MMCLEQIICSETLLFSSWLPNTLYDTDWLFLFCFYGTCTLLQETVTESNNIVFLLEREAGYWVSYLIGG